MSKTKFYYLLKFFSLFALYFVTATFGLHLQAVSRFATLIWIPTGLSLTALLLYGYKVWPGIFLGAFFVNLLTGAPPFVAVGIAIGNTLEALVGRYLLKKYLGFRNSFDRLQDVVSLLLIVAPVAAVISASIGVSSLLYGHVIPQSVYFSTWIPWWIGDVISDYIVTPFLLLWARGVSFNKEPKRIIEFLALVIIVIGGGYIIFRGILGIPVTNLPIIYLVYPLLIWASLRFGQREAASAIVIFSCLAIWSTTQGFGPFAKGKITDEFIYLQLFMCVTAFTSLILSVVVAERKQLENRKDDFIAMTSHELRMPVTVLKLYTEIVKIKLHEKKYIAARKHFSKLEKQTIKLTSLVNELLDVSSIQSEKFLVKKEPFDMNILIKETVDSIKNTTTMHTFSINGKIHNDVIGDRYRIYQVLVNFLTNAVKYSPYGGEISVYCKSIKKSIQICVKDRGVGIDSVHLHKIFEKLYQVEDNIGRRTYSGLGMGLFISSEIIKVHKGKIWVESRKGKGSSFYFTLPVNKIKAK